MHEYVDHTLLFWRAESVALSVLPWLKAVEQKLQKAHIRACRTDMEWELAGKFASAIPRDGALRLECYGIHHGRSAASLAPPRSRQNPEVLKVPITVCMTRRLVSVKPRILSTVILDAPRRACGAGYPSLFSPNVVVARLTISER